jgi:hypothetical protein
MVDRGNFVLASFGNIGYVSDGTLGGNPEVSPVFRSHAGYGKDGSDLQEGGCSQWTKPKSKRKAKGLF